MYKLDESIGTTLYVVDDVGIYLPSDCDGDNRSIVDIEWNLYMIPVERFLNCLVERDESEDSKVTDIIIDSCENEERKIKYNSNYLERVFRVAKLNNGKIDKEFADIFLGILYNELN